MKPFTQWKESEVNEFIELLDKAINGSTTGPKIGYVLCVVPMTEMAKCRIFSNCDQTTVQVICSNIVDNFKFKVQ